MNMVRRGDRGPVVHSIQEMMKGLAIAGSDPEDHTKHVTLLVDGIFGPSTESAVMWFQESEGLLCDGVVGPLTMRALEKAYSERMTEISSPGVDAFDSTPDRHTFMRVPADPYGDGYDRVYLRDDVAEAYRNVYETVHAAGGMLTSSGGKRSLTAHVNSNRSAVSMHYVGRALDLFVYSGMVDPRTDPYVVAREPDVSENGETHPSRLYRVYARCSTDNNPDAQLPEEMEVTNAIKYSGDRTKGETVSGHLLDLTALFAEHGFERIRARPQFEQGGSPLSAEWWHYQYERGLIPHQTTFGQELLRLYSRRSLEDSPPWRHRDNIFKVNWS